MFLYSTLVSTRVTVIILSAVLISMVLYVSVQHTGEYTRDCHYTICSSYINGVVCIWTAHWWVHTWLLIYYLQFLYQWFCMYLYSTLVSTHVIVIILSTVLILMIFYVSVQHTGEYTRDCHYTICSSYINGFVCFCTAHWWVHTWLLLYYLQFLY